MMRLFNLFALSCLFFKLGNCCNELKIESSHGDLSYLHDTIFRLNPTLLADGRPVYEEVRTDGQPSRLIHHFSHDSDIDNGQAGGQDVSNIEFYGPVVSQLQEEIWVDRIQFE